ncbi:MAG: OmpA family protein [Alistipes sp.]|jgi:tetratricopeptide (TPR) repeat protein|nr:OmpA family protein [Alistipes sp.]
MKRIFNTGLAALLLFSALAATAQEPIKQTRQERRADRVFIGGQYQRAMEINTRGEAKLPEGSAERLRLELKMARLYTLLQEYEKAVEYYGKVLAAADTMLTVEDVCLYIDNMRLMGNAQQAEIIARTYAFRSPYNRNQRYLNTLTALSHKQHYYGRGDSDYKVRLYDKSTSKPEYWIGNYGDELFYAVSHSTLQDPLKVYYHRSQYISSSGDISVGDTGGEYVRDSGKDSPLRVIPRELHSGPLAFSPDEKMMVATGIDKSFKDRIVSIDQIRGLYPTQLFYSMVEEKIGRWSAFRPLFNYRPGYSYAHPSFLNDGRSVIFSSDFPGGYGGMDLYVCNWNEATSQWSDPVNLGPYVNTEGDEIYPLVRGNRLYFSSNGLEGFGGYDIYHVTFVRNLSSIGSLFHYPHPVNTTGNDFGAYIDDAGVGYFISDRRGHAGKDDIYTFDSSINSLGSDLEIGVSQQFSAMTGNLKLIDGLGARHNSTNVELNLAPPVEVPENGELLATVYFEFDRYNLSKESRATLDALLADKGVEMLAEVSLVGYADELGTERYNQGLSERRAATVARYLSDGDFRPYITTVGRGQLVIDYDYSSVSPMSGYSIENPAGYVSMADRIKMVSKARRVDIYANKKVAAATAN